MPTSIDMAQQFSGFQCFLQTGNSSCETELEELMHQIDIMVNNKKVEWEKQVKILEQKLEAQDQELTQAKNTLEQKNCEIGILCKKLEDVDKAQCETVKNYERQLQTLRNQLCKLRKSYEKLSFYHQKTQKDVNTENYPEHGWNHSEPRRLTEKLEEFQTRSKEREKQRGLYQNHLKSLNDQTKSLTEKCELFQKESQCCQEQLSIKTRLQNEAITDTQSETQRLRCQLDTSLETNRNNWVIIENLKSAVTEITLSRNSLKDENQQLLRELKKCQKQFQSMEIQLSEAKIELRAHDNLLRAGELKQRQTEIEMPNVNHYKNSHGNEQRIQETNSQKSFKTFIGEPARKSFKLSKSKPDQPPASAISRMPRENAGVPEQASRKHRRKLENVKNFPPQDPGDLGGYPNKYHKLEKGSHGRHRQTVKNSQMVARREEGASLDPREAKTGQIGPEDEMQEWKRSHQESNPAKSGQEPDEQKHQIESSLHLKEEKHADLERLRTDIADLTAKINQKDITIATISDKVSRLEQELELKEHDNMNHQALKQLNGQPNTYEPCIVVCHSENEKLRKHPNMTADQQITNDPKKIQDSLWICGSNWAQDRSLNQTNDGSNKQLSCSGCEPDPCDSDWNILYQSLLLDEECSEGGSPVMEREWCTQNCSLDMDQPEISLLLVCDQQNAPSSTESSFISAAEKFLLEENKRAKDFEMILNSHIDEMKTYSENTLMKYAINYQNRHR
ncbi:deuterosome assembly protein 1 [Rhinophrynus dorsalis]